MIFFYCIRTRKIGPENDQICPGQPLGLLPPLIVIDDKGILRAWIGSKNVYTHDFVIFSNVIFGLIISVERRKCQLLKGKFYIIAP